MDLSRRKFLLELGSGTAAAFVPAGLWHLPFSSSLTGSAFTQNPSGTRESVDVAGLHLQPRYRRQREIEGVLAKVRAGSDAFVTEKYQDQVAAVLRAWRRELLASPVATGAIAKAMGAGFRGSSLKPASSQAPRPADSALRVTRVKFAEDLRLEAAAFWKEWLAEIAAFSKLLTAEFQITSIRASGSGPVSLETRVRFELVGMGEGFFREQRVGSWAMSWELSASGEVGLQSWRWLDETRGRSLEPVLVDVAAQAFAGCASFEKQLVPGTDYWRTVLDGACGIDLYGHNGVALGDIDGDGFDDLYVCQPAGLPNRLYRNRGDGTFEDITDGSGVGLLENTACALFADIDNDGRQELIVVRASGPLLFLNEGGGKFREKPNAFQFAAPPQGTFTGAAIADYDQDGWLDIYFCLYSFYQGADQYRYPSPYFAAENGPPNFLLTNERNGTFRDVTRAAGLNVNNTRFSFCCGWGDAGGGRGPDLYVVNDFGRKNLYRNNEDGTFTDVAPQAGVEDVGAGMSVSWLDYENDGKNDLYVANMWTAAGSRITEQDIFQKSAGAEARAFYRKHAMGNSLYRNSGDTRFADETAQSGAGMGRWAWSSDAWDFDHDGFADLYVTNGMVTGPEDEGVREDLNSFFWRQVVANSPLDAKPSREYEQGWNAINELIRADATWSGFERNVFYRNNQDGTFSDVSAAVGADFVEDARSFALGDLDHDGRVEAVLKNRGGPQLRLLKNVVKGLPPAIAFRLRGTKSNRDAIGAAVTVEMEGGRRQTLYVQAGSGYLAQHSKELLFGLGAQKGPVKASVRWPSGLVQALGELPLNHRVWVEEGAEVSRKEPFRESEAISAGTMGTNAAATMRALPETVETWLLSPVAAPDWGGTGANAEPAPPTLAGLRGKTVLLYFSNVASPVCRENLRDFEAAAPRWGASALRLVVMSTEDSSAELPRAYSQKPFAVVRPSADTLAVYNLLFRSLYDRHRDMPLPCSLLINPQGEIVKLYQGRITAEQIEKDARSIPHTNEERIAKGLPFRGVVGAYEFGRNYLSFGSVFFERGYMGQAEAFFKLALEEDRSSAEAYYGLGSAYLEQQKLEEARANFEKAIATRADYPGTVERAWNNLGILDARAGRTDAAIENFQKALKIDPSYVVALDNLGNAYRQAKDLGKAQQTFRRAIELNATDPEANYGLGMTYAQQNDTEHAFEYLQKALAARPSYPEALNNLGVLYLRTQKPYEAEKSFQEAIRVAPEFDQAYLNLARLYALQNQPQKARAVLQELLKRKPGDPIATSALGQLPQ